MVRLVDRIEAARLVRREPVPTDRRGAYATLTDDGVEMLRMMWPVYARAIEKLFLTPVRADAAVVRDALERVAQDDGSPDDYPTPPRAREPFELRGFMRRLRRAVPAGTSAASDSHSFQGGSRCPALGELSSW
jgi:hypothetical protein